MLFCLFSFFLQVFIHLAFLVIQCKQCSDQNVVPQSWIALTMNQRTIPTKMLTQTPMMPHTRPAVDIFFPATFFLFLSTAADTIAAVPERTPTQGAPPRNNPRTMEAIPKKRDKGARELLAVCGKTPPGCPGCPGCPPCPGCPGCPP